MTPGRFRHSMFTDAEATQLIEDGYLEPDGSATSLTEDLAGELGAEFDAPDPRLSMHVEDPNWREVTLADAWIKFMEGDL